MPYPGPYPGAGPQVVHIVARSGGFKSAVMWVFGMLLFAGVFIIGIMLGAGAMLATSSFETVVLREHYRDGLTQRSTIAVIPIEGVITSHTAEFVRSAVDEVLDDRDVRGVVLRVDSPGGGVAASDEIWYQVDRLKSAGRQVVASYGGLAASGGYYVSCGANSIVAEPTCITGSIGVIAQVLTMEQLMQKIGVQPVTLVASQSPDKDVANNMLRTWTEEDREKLRKILDAAYETFRKRVEAGRGTIISDEARLDAVADGSIFTADEALINGLIDSVGYLDDAIVQAETLIGLQPKSAHVFILREPPSLFGNGLLGQVRAVRWQEHGANATTDVLDAERMRTLLHELTAPRVAYLMH
jgi:protease-4